ncbi:autophagy-related protein 5 [Dioscorea alata]|uniref:Autophagy-related protein 5 n=1 Tax=Dioscorea alata TaxID=55571 RepID=A0ACB7V7K7_DIOAL|nr:autophagy-related protein 5 [Dioscorea alata]
MATTELCSEEALRFIWGGAIPLQIHLHESEVTTLPPPPPALILGPRIGYLPLLVPLLKPYFSSTLPPGVDTVWFDYKGLPLKWNIPTGVLFDLLCAEPERPWNLTVHFRGHPGETLIPCESEDNVKWSFINALKEAAYVINGNCKNVMNLSQADQFELWQSLMKGNVEAYQRIASRLKLGPIGEDCTLKTGAGQPRQALGEADTAGSSRVGRIPVRLYVRNIIQDLDDFDEATAVDSWDSISYINRPVEIHKHEGHLLTLRTALKALLPEIFDDETMPDNQIFSKEEGCQVTNPSFEDYETPNSLRNVETEEASIISDSVVLSKKPKVKLIRIQGIELDLSIPFFWVVNNLMNPDYFIHICVFTEASPSQVLVR